MWKALPSASHIRICLEFPICPNSVSALTKPATSYPKEWRNPFSISSQEPWRSQAGKKERSRKKGFCALLSPRSD